MYELMSLRLKCPKCSHTLMDRDHQIDNVPAIHLQIAVSGITGEIWLSSIYGSYNFKSTVTIDRGQIVAFSCPHCGEGLNSGQACTSCDASMVPFHLDMGGKVSICSRNGCKNHFVEFEDLSVALRNFYQEYGYSGTHFPPAESVPVPAGSGRSEESREIIETGTFLHSYCPSCRKSLISDHLLKLKIRKGEEGMLLLSPYLNVFTSKSTLFLSEEQVVEEISCPHCNHNLVLQEKSCGKCGSPVAMINVGARTKLIDFYICTKKGCRWHGLSEDDIYEIRLESSTEW